MQGEWPTEWVNFNTQKPVEHGYYYIHYVHKDGIERLKAIWWNGQIFAYKDYVVDVIEYLPKPFKYYCPAMIWGEQINAGK